MADTEEPRVRSLARRARPLLPNVGQDERLKRVAAVSTDVAGPADGDRLVSLAVPRPGRRCPHPATLGRPVAVRWPCGQAAGCGGAAAGSCCAAAGPGGSVGWRVRAGRRVLVRGGGGQRGAAAVVPPVDADTAALRKEQMTVPAKECPPVTGWDLSAVGRWTTWAAHSRQRQGRTQAAWSCGSGQPTAARRGARCAVGVSPAAEGDRSAGVRVLPPGRSATPRNESDAASRTAVRGAHGVWATSLVLPGPTVGPSMTRAGAT